MMRVRAVLSGWSGGPGLATFYFRGTTEDSAAAALVVARVRAGFLAAAGLWNRNVSIQVQGDVDVVTVTNGKVTNTISVTAPAVVVGAENDDTYLPLGTSVLLRLKTSTFLSGRRLQGRIFLSPLGGNQGDPNGTPNATALAAANAMAAAIFAHGSTEPTWAVWRRPRAVKPATHPATFDRDGDVADITTWSSPDKYAILRSRRD